METGTQLEEGNRDAIGLSIHSIGGKPGRDWFVYPLDGVDGDITELILQGYSTPEIGERLGFTARTDGRVKTPAKQRMRPMNAEYTHLS